MEPVGQAVIRPDGSFETTLPDVPADTDGEVELFFSWSDGMAGEMNTSALINEEQLETQGAALGDLQPQDADTGSADAEAAAAEAAGDVVEDLGAETASTAEVIEAGELGGVTYADVEVSVAPEGTAAAGTNGPITAAECRSLGGSTQWHYIKPYGVASNTSRNIYAPVQRVRTENRTTSRYTLEHTKGTKTSLFFQSGTKFVAGGLSTAISESSSLGAGVNIGAEKSRIIKTKVNYRKFKQMCRSESPLRTIWWNMDGRSWQPQKTYLGQIDFGYWSTPFSCHSWNKRYFTSSDIWVARTSAFYFSGSFTLAGALGASREQNSSTVSTKSHIRRSGYYGFTLCGQDGPDPNIARDMKEVRASS